MTSPDQHGKTFSYDVFLSHNQADKPRVRRLAERLRAAGLRVWFDEWVIQPGESPSPVGRERAAEGRVRDQALAIEHGLEASRTLVLCLSPAALGSDWVGLERSTVLFRDPANAGRRFIPLLLADCKLPATLRRYKYVDFREEAEVAIGNLLASITSKGEIAAVGSPARTTPDRSSKREAFLEMPFRNQLLKIGDWDFDDDKKVIVGAGVHTYLISSQTYGDRSFTIRAQLSFDDFRQHLLSGSEQMNAGFVLGWRVSDKNPRYLNVLLTGDRLLLERIGFSGGEAFRDFAHLTEGVAFSVTESRIYSFCVAVSERAIDVFVDEKLTAVLPKPEDIRGGVGLRPWRSRVACHRVTVNE